MTEANKHALLSPSGAHRWMACPGSVRMEQGMPDTSNEYSAEGTALHDLAALCLRTQQDAAAFTGRIFTVDGYDFEIDEDRAEAVQTYVETVRDYQRSTGGTLFVESKLPIGHLTGEPDAEGTGDAVLVCDDEIIVIDAKFGRGVAVSAEDNPQLKLYALGAVEQYGAIAEFKRARLVIVQPRLASVPSEWPIDMPDLMRFADQVKERANHAMAVLRSEKAEAVEHHLRPSESACKWCKAKPVCPKLASEVEKIVGAEFEVIAEQGPPEVPPAERLDLQMDFAQEAEGAAQFLANCMSAVGMVEDWCKAVRAETERRLTSGVPVPGYKLVEGRAGPRKWTTPEEVEQLLRKTFRLTIEEAYNLKLISPTQAEKVLAKESPKRWAKLQPLITRSEPKLSVAPESDPRPAATITPTADEFSDITHDASDLV